MRTDPREYAFNPGVGGLTIREYMATHIMAGFAACPNIRGQLASVAASSVQWADALIEALNKPKEKTDAVPDVQ